MKQLTYIRNGEEFIVEELNRKELKWHAEWFIEDWSGMERDFDDVLHIEYADGSCFHLADDGCEGRYRKTNIVFGLITNGSTQQVFGAYEVDDNGIVQRKEA